MLRYTSKIQQALEKGKAEGRTEGRDEVYRAWYADWQKRKQEADEKGIPFTEPPPHNPENNEKE